MRSMTGYGKANYFDNNYELEIEIKSVNNRFLDYKFYSPREINYLEMNLRDRLRSKIKRGKVEVRINFSDKRLPKMELNKEKLKIFWDIFNEAKDFLKIQADVSLEKILEENEVIQLKEKNINNKELENIIFRLFDQALSEHQKMALAEGASMKKSITDSIGKIRNALKTIKTASPKHKEASFANLKARIKEILAEELAEESYKRLMLETAIYIDKMDVNEEIIRLENHLSKFDETLSATDNEIGKTLNFILQEMHREINTISSKFNSGDVFSEILLIKEEIEKCREMIQNVE